MAIFGKGIRLVVYDGSKNPVLETRDLRVDFDIRLLQGFNRAKVDIYNLASSTIKEMSNGERYVSLWVSLHGSPEVKIMDSYYVNNAYTEKRVPNSITSLYCIDSLRKTFTSQQAEISVKKPGLKRVLESLKTFSTGTLHFEYIDFPPDIEKFDFTAPVYVFSGEVADCLDELGKQYGFTHHMSSAGNNIRIIELVYRPLQKNIHQTTQSDRAKITLLTSNMRSNPIVGVAQLQIESNLDPLIRCGSLLDTSQLLTATVEDGFDTLVIDDQYLNSSVSGWSIFNVLSCNHLGSTHSSKWSTKAIAYKSAKGTHLSKYNWYE